MKSLLGKILGIIILLTLAGCNSSNKSKQNATGEELMKEGIYEGVFIDINNTEIPAEVDPNVIIEKRLFRNINLVNRDQFWDSKSNFHLHAMGSIEIPESNYYYFRLTSSGSVLFKLNNKDLVDNRVIHEKESNRSKTYLEKGFTIFEFEYFPGINDPYLVMEWSKDGKEYEVIPDNVFNNLDAFAVENWTGENKEDKMENGMDNVLTENERKEGWKLLFDGKTTKGWHTYNKPGTIGKKWKAQEGALVFEGRERFEFYVAGRKIELGPVDKALDGGEDIVSDEAFENFELSLEWKISEAGNNGIFYTVQENIIYDEIWKTSPEMQVQDNAKHKDGLINKHRAGDLYDLIAADPIRVRPQGEWNKVRIVKNNGKIEHWLNGTKVLNYDVNTSEWKDMISKSKFASLSDFAKPGPGKIGFQDHDNKVYYKNIKIRELSNGVEK